MAVKERKGGGGGGLHRCNESLLASQHWMLVLPSLSKASCRGEDFYSSGHTVRALTLTPRTS